METRAKEKKREMEKLDELFRMGYVTESQYKERRTALEKGRSQDHYQHTREDHFTASTSSFDTHSPSLSLAAHSVDSSHATAADSQWEVYTPSLWASSAATSAPSPSLDKGKEEEREERPMRWGDFEGEGHVSSSSRWADMVDDISAMPFAELHESSWKRELSQEMSLPYFTSLMDTLDMEARAKEIFPPRDEVFAAYELTPLSKVKVVILGQDPYHDDGQAHGLCFSVKPGVQVPPSLKNLYKELSNDIPGFVPPSHGCLVKWAEAGVLLLNATLTVEAHNANSHSKLGWQRFTDKTISIINAKREGVVFILFGAFAQKKGAKVDRQKHCVIEAAHPSPLSAHKFFGCKVFSKANQYLSSIGKQPIDWHLDENPHYP